MTITVTLAMTTTSLTAICDVKITPEVVKNTFLEQMLIKPSLHHDVWHSSGTISLLPGFELWSPDSEAPGQPMSQDPVLTIFKQFEHT